VTTSGRHQAVVGARWGCVANAKVQPQTGRIQPAVLLTCQIKRHHLIPIRRKGIRACGHHLDQPSLSRIGSDRRQLEAQLADKAIVLTCCDCKVHRVFDTGTEKLCTRLDNNAYWFSRARRPRTFSALCARANAVLVFGPAGLNVGRKRRAFLARLGADRLSNAF